MSSKRLFEEAQFGSQDTDEGTMQAKRSGSKPDYSYRIRELVQPRPLADSEAYLKIISWNVNGLKSLATTHRARLNALVAKHRPDILFFEETKIQDVAVGDFAHLLPGYESFWNCSTTKKGYSGTAMFVNTTKISVPAGLPRSPAPVLSSKKQTKLSALWKTAAPDPDTDDEGSQPERVAQQNHNQLASVVNVSYDFEDQQKCHAGEGRTITVEFDAFILVACYVPNSGEGLKRLDDRVQEWEPHMRTYLQALSARKPVVYGGDLNVSHLDIDLHDPFQAGAHQLRGHTPRERAAFDQLLTETGFRDTFRHFYPDAKGQFTFWEQYIAANRPHNKGVRLDYFLCSPDLFASQATALTSSGGGAGTQPAAAARVCGNNASAAPAEAVEHKPSSECEDMGGLPKACEETGGTGGGETARRRRVWVHDSYILHEDTVGVSDHCPIVLVLQMGSR